LVVEGTARDGIVAVAQSRHIDLIVMGTHGRTGLKHLMLGSVAEVVVRTADCPVVTVRGAAK
jgi:nucleotide-binding universal stress UspA family protein